MRCNERRMTKKSRRLSFLVSSLRNSARRRAQAKPAQLFQEWFREFIWFGASAVASDNQGSTRPPPLACRERHLRARLCCRGALGTTPVSPSRLTPHPSDGLLLGLRLNKMALQAGQDRLGLCERQSQRRRRAAGHAAAAGVHLMHLLGTNSAGQLHHDPPLHPASPISAIRPVLPRSAGYPLPRGRSHAYQKALSLLWPIPMEAMR